MPHQDLSQISKDRATVIGSHFDPTGRVIWLRGTRALEQARAFLAGLVNSTAPRRVEAD